MMQTTTDWETIRAQFRALSDWTYLNSASFDQVPQCAIEAVDRHWQRRDQLACGGFLSWYDDADRLRTAIASLIHASAEDIAFIGNTSTALALMVAGLDWRPGDNVV